MMGASAEAAPSSPGEPPVERVEEDAVPSAQYAALLGGLVVGFAALFPVNLLVLSGSLGISLPGSSLVTLVGVAVELVLTGRYPRVRPLLTRVGLSPRGLYLGRAGSFRRRGVAWWKLLVGPGWVEDTSGIGKQRYRQTDRPLERLSHFRGRPWAAGLP